MKRVMQMFGLAMALLAISVSSGCAMQKASPSFNYDPYANAGRGPAEAQGSLFASDQAVLSNEDIDRILSADIALPDKARLAVMKIGPQSRYWSEESPILDQQTAASLLEALRKCPRIASAASLPNILVPDKITVPYLREAAARYRCDVMLVYRVGGGQYEKYRWTKPDEVKAFCNVEAVLLDVRSGIVPFTTVVFQEINARRSETEISFDETTDKAYRDAEGAALVQIAAQLTAFLQQP